MSVQRLNIGVILSVQRLNMGVFSNVQRLNMGVFFRMFNDRRGNAPPITLLIIIVFWRYF